MTRRASGSTNATICEAFEMHDGELGKVIRIVIRMKTIRVITGAYWKILMIKKTINMVPAEAWTEENA